MNSVQLTGRLTRDPETKYAQGEKATAITRYSIAVDRVFKGNGDQQADFVNIVAFGKAGEFAEKYFRKGMKVGIVGRIQTGSYTNKDGVKVYTTDIVAEQQEFEEKKESSSSQNGATSSAPVNTTPDPQDDGFMAAPDDEELPFN